MYPGLLKGGEREEPGMNKFPGTALESKRDVVKMRMRLELQFLGDGMVQNWLFQVENDCVSH